MPELSACTHVLVVGGGFAGVACSKVLAEDERVSVTLLDKNGYHQFQPLLYQVATAELSSHDMSFDLHELFARDGSVQVRRAEAAWLGVHAELLANVGAEMRAFFTWAEEFYFRPHHRSADLLDATQLDTPRIDWGWGRAQATDRP